MKVPAGLTDCFTKLLEPMIENLAKEPDDTNRQIFAMRLIHLVTTQVIPLAFNMGYNDGVSMTKEKAINGESI